MSESAVGIISLIAAMTPTGVIGRDNQLPWHLPTDLQHFKCNTLHKPIVMGRVTYESIGKPLPQRENIVLTRQTDFVLPKGVQRLTSIEAVLALRNHYPEVMVIGGATLYQQFLPYVQRLYLTTVYADDILGDTFFPSINYAEWQEINVVDHPADMRHAYAYRFSLWERLSQPPNEGC